MNNLGLFGKLPTHGDFVQRNLPAGFVSGWDGWLQSFIAGTKEQIGVDWLDIYLTSPIWRFVFSHGVIDEHKWIGIMMPSVDHVGRYYPFTIAGRLPDYANPLEYIALQGQWFTDLEELALRALDGEFELDELESELSGLDIRIDTLYQPAAAGLESFAMTFELEFEEQSATSIYPFMLDVFMSKSMNSYSVWSTTGSERVAPCLFCVQNLPPVGKTPAMLDGNWKAWGWQQPYTLQPE